ncbi:MAG: hypothetical protein HY719_10545, partial [Planctomycetes bacterium]|nr:hypothetical protein [Planctomycetota bacterium]
MAQFSERVVAVTRDLAGRTWRVARRHWVLSTLGALLFGVGGVGYFVIVPLMLPDAIQSALASVIAAPFSFNQTTARFSLLEGLVVEDLEVLGPPPAGGGRRGEPIITVKRVRVKVGLSPLVREIVVDDPVIRFRAEAGGETSFDGVFVKGPAGAPPKEYERAAWPDLVVNRLVATFTVPGVVRGVGREPGSVTLTAPHLSLRRDPADAWLQRLVGVANVDILTGENAWAIAGEVRQTVVSTAATVDLGFRGLEIDMETLRRVFEDSIVRPAEEFQPAGTFDVAARLFYSDLTAFSYQATITLRDGRATWSRVPRIAGRDATGQVVITDGAVSIHGLNATAFDPADSGIAAGGGAGAEGEPTVTVSGYTESIRLPDGRQKKSEDIVVRAERVAITAERVEALGGVDAQGRPLVLADLAPGDPREQMVSIRDVIRKFKPEAGLCDLTIR